MDEYTYTTVNTAKVRLEAGWYTPEDLQRIIDLKKLHDKHLRESMKVLNEEKNDPTSN